MAINNLNKTNKFGAWLSKINELIDGFNNLSTTLVDGYAPKKHISESDEYGKANETEYGHVKLSDDVNSDSSSMDGVAASSKAIKIVNDSVISLTEQSSSNTEKLNEMGEAISELTNSVGDKAPINHASESKQYGIGSDIEYGHIKLSDIVSLKSVSDGVAATPSAVKSVDDKVENVISDMSGKAPINHASETDEYGVANEYDFGHVRLIDNIATNAVDYTGTAVGMSVVKEIHEIVMETKATVDILESNNSNVAEKNHASTTDEHGLGTDTEYGHVKLSDALDMPSSVDSGIAATPYAVYQINQTLERVNETTSEVSRIVNTAKSAGQLGDAIQLSIEDNLNDVITSGLYVSNSPNYELNYPFETSGSQLAYLIVTKIETTELVDTESEEDESIQTIKPVTLLKQIIYADTAVYIRHSYDDGESWTVWNIIGYESSNQTIKIYLSPTAGDDKNSGYDPVQPIKTMDKFISILNAYKKIISYSYDPNIYLYLDTDEYTEIHLRDIPYTLLISSYSYEDQNFDEFEDADNIIDGSNEVEQISEDDTTTNPDDTETGEDSSTEEPSIPEEDEVDVKLEEFERTSSIIKTLRIEKSNVTISKLKIDNLVLEDSVVVLDASEYMSIGYINVKNSELNLSKNGNSTLFIHPILNDVVEEELTPEDGSEEVEQISEDDTTTNPDDTETGDDSSTEEPSIPEEPTINDTYRHLYAIIQADSSNVYSESNREIFIKSNVNFSYLVHITKKSDVNITSVIFTLEDIESVNDTSGQIHIDALSYVQYRPRLLPCDPARSIISSNSFVNNVLVGNRSGIRYLRDDGSWTRIFSESIVVEDDIILDNTYNTQHIFVKNNSVITVPSVGNNYTFFIKNVGTDDVVVHPEEIFIDGSSEDIILNPYEYIKILQYDETNYAIISEKRIDDYQLLDLNLEDIILTKNTTIDE